MSTDASAQAFPIGQAAPVILWGIRHAKDLPTIRANFNAVGTAQNLLPKYEAWKVSSDFIVSLLADFPNIDEIVNRFGSHTLAADALSMYPDANGVYTFAACGTQLTEANIQAVADAHQLKLGDGTIIRLVLENLPAVIAAIMQIIGIFK